MAETIPIPITPAGIQWVYIGEGAANVVYRMLVLLPRTPLPGQLTDRVAQMWDYQIRRELLQKFEGKSPIPWYLLRGAPIFSPLFLHVCPP